LDWGAKSHWLLRHALQHSGDNPEQFRIRAGSAKDNADIDLDEPAKRQMRLKIAQMYGRLFSNAADKNSEWSTAANSSASRHFRPRHTPLDTIAIPTT
jgi:hypothetical protein